MKRMVLTRFWINDTVYAKADGEAGTVVKVQIATDRCVPSYYVVMSDRKGEWCEEMELTHERTFNGGAGKPA